MEFIILAVIVVILGVGIYATMIGWEDVDKHKEAWRLYEAGEIDVYELNKRLRWR